MIFARYERMAEHYTTLWPLLVPGYDAILSAMRDIVLALPARPREILDLGCGPGTATAAVASACDAEARVTLVDGSPAMLREAQRALQAHLRAVVAGDFTSPAIAGSVFVPERYDLALASFALHHLPDPTKRAVLEHVAGALVPGGLLLLADEIATDRPAGWDVVARLRSRRVADHVARGRIPTHLWQLESELATRLPLFPARIDDLTSWMARAGLAVSCPISLLGSALLIGLRA